MPRAVVVREFGAPETYKLEPFEPRAVGPGEILVKIRTIGVSYVDVLTAEGKYQVKPPLPFIPGSECAGIVEEVGAGVTHLKVGDEVMGSSFGGVFAEANTFRATSFNRIPAGLSFEEGAVFPPSYLTAAHALTDRANVQAGETVLVIGAAGATGIAAIQTAKALGARVIASASSAEKRELCLRAGADAAIDSGSENWREDVKDANLQKAIDVVFDPVGGKFTDPAFRSLGYGGRYLVIGFTGGIASLQTNLPLVKTASLIGVQLRTFGMEEPEKMAVTQARMMDWAKQNLLKPMIGKTFALEDYVEAMREAAAGKVAGRIILSAE